eukprot:7038276-Pyramimonas_sp.AAC.1
MARARARRLPCPAASAPSAAPLPAAREGAILVALAAADRALGAVVGDRGWAVASDGAAEVGGLAVSSAASSGPDAAP